jgi:hypothetical protein
MLLVDNSVLKMYQLKSQLTLQIKSVAFFCFITSPYILCMHA